MGKRELPLSFPHVTGGYIHLKSGAVCKVTKLVYWSEKTHLKTAGEIALGTAENILKGYFLSQNQHIGIDQIDRVEVITLRPENWLDRLGAWLLGR